MNQLNHKSNISQRFTAGMCGLNCLHLQHFKDAEGGKEEDLKQIEKKNTKEKEGGKGWEKKKHIQQKEKIHKSLWRIRFIMIEWHAFVYGMKAVFVTARTR